MNLTFFRVFSFAINFHIDVTPAHTYNNNKIGCPFSRSISFNFPTAQSEMET